jgi:hypothetical protein
MKKCFVLAAMFIFAAAVSLSCKTVARAAARYWTKRQIKEFVNNCEEKSSKLIGEQSAKKFCDCAVDKVAEEYKNYQDSKTVSITNILQIANDCR